MSRSTLPVLCLLALTITLPTKVDADLPPDSPPPAGCTIDVRTYNSRSIACAVVSTAPVRHFVFKANFSGGHDDTAASITPMLDGQPLTCDVGSKPSLFGEDGDVSTWCAFAMPESKTQSALKVEIRWSHAEYTNFEFGTRAEGVMLAPHAD